VPTTGTRNPVARAPSRARRPAAAPSTARRSPCCRLPTSPTSCTGRSPAPAPPGTTAARAQSGPTLYRIGMTTDLTEQDVIMGRGEKAAVSRHQAGHRRLRAEGRLPLLHLRSGADRRRPRGRGQGGQRALGRAGGAGRLRRLLRHQEPRQPHRRRSHVQVRDRHPRAGPVAASAQRPGIRVHDVNLIGEYNIAGEFWHVAPLFDELGLRILCTLSGDARFHEVQTMHRAASVDGGLRQGAAQRRAQARKRLRRALLRGQLLRHHRHLAGLPRLRPLLGDADLRRAPKR
jgi:hypothetical protein